MNSYGFTGTRDGMTPRQQEALDELLCHHNSMDMKFHHGGCRGADREAHKIAALYTCRIVHPMEGDASWHGRTDYGDLQPPRPPLDRNHDIVDACDVLIAAPRSLIEERRSGTWATIRYARRVGRPIIILDPGGAS